VRSEEPEGEKDGKKAEENKKEKQKASDSPSRPIDIPRPQRSQSQLSYRNSLPDPLPSPLSSNDVVPAEKDIIEMDEEYIEENDEGDIEEPVNSSDEEGRKEFLKPTNQQTYNNPTNEQRL